ncbi:MAG: ATP-binding protein [Magnetococcus sp. DMHC-6]
MLIEFTVANYGSFKEPQRLEMTPDENISSLSEHCFDTGILEDQPKQLLRSALVYGPNASGKSHLIHAVSFMREFVLNSNRKEVEKSIKVKPFLLDAKSRFEPSAFQMIFVMEGRRCQYGFKVDKKRVWSEWCYIFTGVEENNILFRREYDPAEDVYQVESDGLEGIENVLQSVPEDWLAITQFGQEKKKRWPELASTYRWFYKRLKCIDSNEKISSIQPPAFLRKKSGMDWVLRFMKAADFGVENLRLKEKDMKKYFGWYKMFDSIPEIVRTTEMVRTIPQTEEQVSFTLSQESTGTNKMFDWAGHFWEFFSEGKVFFVDEIESGLHHRLVRFLLDLIHDPERNIHGSQLIATTHDTALLDDRIIRPDQIWLINKDREYVSHISPLSDFDIKLEAGETLQQFYLDGLFGAVPMVRKRRVDPVGRAING